MSEIDEEMMMMNGVEEQPAPAHAQASGSREAISAIASLETSTTDGEPKMSKNAMKKAAKQARMKAIIPLKRQAEKARRRERTQQLKQGLREGTLSEAEREQIEAKIARDKERRIAIRANKRGTELDKDVFEAGVLIDLGFDDLMAENEITSMSGQLGYVYSANRLAKRPFSALMHSSAGTSLSPRLWEKMAKTGYERWGGCYWYDDGLETFVEEFQNPPDRTTAPPDQARPAVHLPPDISASSHSLVYLSADSEDELSTLSPSDIYIIGGIVDRNRYKNLCQGKAEKLGIRTARLPIGKFLEVEGRKVLTVNQVFSILVEYVERQDWRAAFEAVIPPRKIIRQAEQAVGDAAAASASEADQLQAPSASVGDAEDTEEAAMNV